MGIGRIEIWSERTSAAAVVCDACGAAIMGRLGLVNELNCAKRRATSDYPNNLIMQFGDQIGLCACVENGLGDGRDDGNAVERD